MTKGTRVSLEFPACNRRRVEASFDGGHITSDGGVLLLRQAAKGSGLLRRVTELIDDPRQRAKCEHSFLSMLEQRVFGYALGYEDLNDHETLRSDIALQTAVGRSERLAHPSTLCRLEKRADHHWAWAAHQAMFEHFVTSFKSPPEEIVLDFDNTDDRVHGSQVGRYFHGYYRSYCFLPLYVFCGDHLLVAHLQPSDRDGATHATGILALLVRSIRKLWPDSRIVIRGDGGFCRWRLLRWCDRNNVSYIIGLPQNKRVVATIQDELECVAELYEQHKETQRVYVEVLYGAKTWDRERRVIAKAEHMARGSNPRFVVTNTHESPEALYRKYCARGDMENRIKEQQLDLFADRTSCHEWWPNQWRLMLSALAYTLLATIRRLALAGTELANATCGTIRLKLLKIGAVMLRNTRRVRFLLSNSYPNQDLFKLASLRLGYG